MRRKLTEIIYVRTLFGQMLWDVLFSSMSARACAKKHKAFTRDEVLELRRKYVEIAHREGKKK